MTDIFCIENYFSETELTFIESFTGTPNDLIPDVGPYAGRVLATYTNLLQNSALIEFFQSKLETVLKLPFQINSVTQVDLYLPWDLHNDLMLEQCSTGYIPYYNILIPLANVHSRTIVFDQYSTESPHFSDYKAVHNPVDNPIDQEFWDKNLSMCWPQDRAYLTIKKIMPYQQRGHLHVFPSCYFHSSDNFHLHTQGPKKFIQVRTEVTS